MITAGRGSGQGTIGSATATCHALHSEWPRSRHGPIDQRASHTRPWTDCASDAERLDVFNGFLLNANLDALFDRFLITFGDSDELRVSPAIPAMERTRLGLDEPLNLRWMAQEHIAYTRFHRERFRAAS